MFTQTTAISYAFGIHCPIPQLVDITTVSIDRVWKDGMARKPKDTLALEGDVVLELGRGDWHVLVPQGDDLDNAIYWTHPTKRYIVQCGELCEVSA